MGMDMAQNFDELDRVYDCTCVVDMARNLSQDMDEADRGLGPGPWWPGFAFRKLCPRHSYGFAEYVVTCDGSGSEYWFNTASTDFEFTTPPSTKTRTSTAGRRTGTR